VQQTVFAAQNECHQFFFDSENLSLPSFFFLASVEENLWKRAEVKQTLRFRPNCALHPSQAVSQKQADAQRGLLLEISSKG